LSAARDDMEHVVALMRLRGVEPSFRKYARKYGSRRARREARARQGALRLVAPES
jgi:hypothetical protein